MRVLRPVGLTGLIVVAGMAAATYFWLRPRGPSAEDAAIDASAPMVAVTVPETLSAAALAGKAAFNENCAACHGANAAGSGSGPPLVHIIYEPGHHADIAFLLAAQRGVRAHHWSFGDMPAQPETSPRQVEAIVAYVRELQRANDIR